MDTSEAGSTGSQLSDMSQSLFGFAQVGFVVLFIAASFYFLTIRPIRQFLSFLLVAIPAGISVFILPYLMNSFVPAKDNKVSDNVTEIPKPSATDNIKDAKPSINTTKPSVPTKANNTVNIDWGLVGLISLIIFGTLVIGASVWFSLNKLKKHKELLEVERGKRDALINRYKEKEALQNRILQEYLKFETDPWAPIITPAFYLNSSDRNSSISNFLESMTTASSLKILNLNYLTEENFEKYRRAVDLLNSSWKSARYYALTVDVTKIGLTLESSTLISKIEAILNQARQTSNHFEASLAFNRAKDLINKLVKLGEVRITDKKLQEIESVCRLELTAATLDKNDSMFKNVDEVKEELFS